MRSLLHCKRGHLKTAQNTGHIIREKTGAIYTYCKTCKAEQAKLKYRNDEAFRKSESLRYKKRAQNGLGKVSG